MTSRCFKVPMVAAAVLFAGGLGLPAVGHADTFGTVYNITYAGCCGSGPLNGERIRCRYDYADH